MCPACTWEFGTPPEHRNPVLHLLPLGPPWQPLSNHIQRSRSGEQPLLRPIHLAPSSGAWPTPPSAAGDPISNTIKQHLNDIKATFLARTHLDQTAATSDWGRSAPKIQIDPIHKNPAPIRARQQRLLKHPTTQRQSMPIQQLEAISGAHFYLTIRRASRRPTEPSANEPSAPSTARTHHPRQLCVLATRSNSHRMQIPTVTAAWPRAEKAVSQHQAGAAMQIPTIDRTPRSDDISSKPHLPSNPLQHRQQHFCRPTPTIDRTARQIRHPIAPASAIQPKLGGFRVQHPRSFASPKSIGTQSGSPKISTDLGGGGPSNHAIEFGQSSPTSSKHPAGKPSPTERHRVLRSQATTRHTAWIG
ncbi:hypothetical protein ACLOJK_007516 [Asimina triloba]